MVSLLRLLMRQHRRIPTYSTFISTMQANTTSRHLQGTGESHSRDGAEGEVMVDLLTACA